MLAVLAPAGCSPAHEGGRAAAGNALATDGAQSSGTVGNEHTRVGEIWYFALPVPYNTSSKPIEIKGVAVEHIPSGIRVLEYGAYDLNDTEGLPLLAKEGESYTPEFAKLKNYVKHPVKVAAGKESNVFYLAKMEITAPPKDTVRECRFAYEQGGRAYTQTLDCELDLKVSEQGSQGS
ncbi:MULTISPECIES: hypothetical protein [Streptomyces]|uniref:hypothetical protein n=1 Tax=Streptomyces TaxID=1883 RepID=UPI001673CFCC|nr:MULTISPECIES: hypothetical protein [Streptomyces]MBK3521589.1 hypothetical protein [Streptomyces sp. MBT70]GGR89071.1 hypothetical protein GCM10010236_49580 [Streptomyces eurythermus]